MIGRVAIDNFAYKTVPFLKVTGDFSWNGERRLLRGLRLRHESGELTADLLEAPNDFRVNLESGIDPTALRGLVHRKRPGSSESGNGAGHLSCVSLFVVPVALQQRGPETGPWHFSAPVSAAPG